MTPVRSRPRMCFRSRRPSRKIGCLRRAAAAAETRRRRYSWAGRRSGRREHLRRVRAGALLGQAQLRQAPIGDEVAVLLHDRRVHAQHAAGHGVSCVLDFQFRALEDHLDDLLLELFRPQLRVLELDLVDHVDAEVQVHGFVAQDVLELLGHTGHLVASTH